MNKIRGREIWCWLCLTSSAFGKIMDYTRPGKLSLYLCRMMVSRSKVMQGVFVYVRVRCIIYNDILEITLRVQHGKKRKGIRPIMLASWNPCKASRRTCSHVTGSIGRSIQTMEFDISAIVRTHPFPIGRSCGFEAPWDRMLRIDTAIRI